MASTTTSLLTLHWATIFTTQMMQFLYQIKKPSRNRQFNIFKRIKAVQYSLLLIGMFRAQYLSTLNTQEDLIDHLPYNPLMTSALLRFRFLSGPTLKAISLLALFAIHIDYTVSFKSDTYLVKVVQQLLLENSSRLFELNRRVLIKPTARYYRLYRRIKQRSRLYRTLWRSTNLHFNRQHLEIFPNLSKHLRAQLVVITDLFDRLIAIILIVVALILISFFLGFTIFIYSELSSPLLALSTIDLLVILYGIWNSIRMALFLIHLGILLSHLSNAHIKQLTDELYKAVGLSELLINFRYQYLQLLYREYQRIQYLAEYTNRQIISPNLTSFFLANIALNIVMLSYLIFGRLYPAEKIALILLCFVQMVFPLQGWAALVSWSNSLYTPERKLYVIQLRLASQRDDPVYRRALLTSVKVKLATFYSQFVCTDRRFYFTLGPFGVVSKKALYEFLFTYSGMVMYVCKIVRKHSSTN